MRECRKNLRIFKSKRGTIPVCYKSFDCLRAGRGDHHKLSLRVLKLRMVWILLSGRIAKTVSDRERMSASAASVGIGAGAICFRHIYSGTARADILALVSGADHNAHPAVAGINARRAGNVVGKIRKRDCAVSAKQRRLVCCRHGKKHRLLRAGKNRLWRGNHGHHHAV